jgi:hypothetical protein
MKTNLLFKLLVGLMLIAPLMLSAQSSEKIITSEKIKHLKSINTHSDELPSALKMDHEGSSEINLNTKRAVEVIWTNTFEDPDEWVESNSSSTPGGVFVITDVFPQSLISQGFGPEFNSTIGGNFAFIDSDAEGVGASQLANLTIIDPIDLSEYDDVLLVFENYFRRFQETHRVGISLDNQNWEYITVNAVPVNTTSANPEITRVDISDFAGGQPEVWIRFQYQGTWDWFWCIDNIQITELPEISTAVSNPYNPSASYATPINHYAGLEIPFGLNVRNLGQAVDSVLVTVEVENLDDGTILHSDEILINSLPRSADSFLVFENNFVPELNQLTIGSYSVNYTVETPGRPDFDPTDNSASFTFILTESVFALDDPQINTFNNSVIRQDDTWYWGAAYYIAPQEENAPTPKFFGSDHAFRVEGGEYTNEVALVYLLEYVADGGPSYTFGDLIGADLQTPPDVHQAFTQIAIAIIDTELLASVDQGEIFHIPFNDYLSPLDLSPFEDPIELKEDKLYFVVTQIDQGAGEPSLRIAFNPSITYDTRVNNGILYTDGRNYTGFTDASPVIRMHVGDIVNSTQILTASGINIKAYPNPAMEQISFSFPEEISGMVELEIYDSAGRKIKSSQHNIMAGSPIVENVGDFVTGRYLVRIMTKNGEETIQIVISK